MNNKGLSIVELVVSFAMVAVLMVIITSMVVNVQETVSNEEVKTRLIEYKNTLTKVIYEDILYSDTNVNRMAYCPSEMVGTCVDFYNSNGDTYRLILEKNRRTGYEGEIQNVIFLNYRGIRYMVPDSDLNEYELDASGNIKSETTIIDVKSFELTQDDNNHIYTLTIPIVHKGIQYSEEIKIVITNLNIRDKKFTEIEYLRTEGKGYFDTGILYNGKYGIEFKGLQEGSAPNHAAWFGARTTYDDTRTQKFVVWGESDNWAINYFTTTNRSVTPFSPNTIYVVKFNKNVLSINGTTYNYYGSVSTQTTPVTLTLGGVNNRYSHVAGTTVYNGDNQVDYRLGKLRIYYCKIWDENQNLIRDYVPVKDSKGVECLYDRVTKSFYYLIKRTS